MGCCSPWRIFKASSLWLRRFKALSKLQCQFFAGSIALGLEPGDVDQETALGKQLGNSLGFFGGVGNWWIILLVVVPWVLRLLPCMVNCLSFHKKCQCRNTSHGNSYTIFSVVGGRLWDLSNLGVTLWHRHTTDSSLSRWKSQDLFLSGVAKLGGGFNWFFLIYPYLARGCNLINLTNMFVQMGFEITNFKSLYTRKKWHYLCSSCRFENFHTFCLETTCFFLLPCHWNNMSNWRCSDTCYRSEVATRNKCTPPAFVCSFFKSQLHPMNLT